jgi:hypothetical protein
LVDASLADSRKLFTATLDALTFSWQKGISIMKWSLFARLSAVLFPVLLATEIAAVQSKPEKSTNPTTPVTGSGCLQAGVERGCYVLQDTKTGKLYNLFFNDARPEVNTMIKFAGRLHSGPTICMQGTPVEVQRFARLKPACFDEKKGGKK